MAFASPSVEQRRQTAADDCAAEASAPGCPAKPAHGRGRLGGTRADVQPGLAAMDVMEARAGIQAAGLADHA